MNIQDLRHYGLFARTRKYKPWWMMKRVLFALSAMLFLCPVILRTGGSAGPKLPDFIYTGTYALLDDGDGNWRIRFLTSGTLTFAKRDATVDVFCVGGGGAGAATSTGCSSGAGGKTAIGTVTVVSGTEYSIVVGAGAISSGQGGTSSAFGVSAAGGFSGVGTTGGSGGTGGSATSAANANGASNGSNGNESGGTVGIGQGTTTREFYEDAGALYAGSGGACRTSATEATGGEGGGGTGGKYGTIASAPGAANTGGGGGAQVTGSGIGGGKSGGSGIVILRNHRTAA